MYSSSWELVHIHVDSWGFHLILQMFSWWLVLKFIKMPLEDKHQRKIYRKEKKDYMILNFDILEVLMVAGVECLPNETCI